MVAMIVQALLERQEIEKKRAAILVKAIVEIGRTEIAEVARVKAMEGTPQKLAEEVETEETKETEEMEEIVKTKETEETAEIRLEKRITVTVEVPEPKPKHLQPRQELLYLESFHKEDDHLSRKILIPCSKGTKNLHRMVIANQKVVATAVRMAMVMVEGISQNQIQMVLGKLVMAQGITVHQTIRGQNQ